MKDWVIPIAAAVGVGGLAILFVIILHAAIQIVQRRKRIRQPRVRSRMTGTYRPHVDFAFPEPADQVPDEPFGDVPTVPHEWPGRVR